MNEMGKTIAEKIESKIPSDSRAGDIVIAEVDLVFAQDATGLLSLAELPTPRETI